MIPFIIVAGLAVAIVLEVGNTRTRRANARLRDLIDDVCTTDPAPRPPHAGMRL